MKNGHNEGTPPTLTMFNVVEAIAECQRHTAPEPFNGATLIRAGEEAYRQLEPLVDTYNDLLCMGPRVWLAKDRHQQPYYAVGTDGFNIVFRYDGRQ